jgi:hypothetical protein
VLTQSTVTTHIGRLAAKLGMSGRHELEAAAPMLLRPRDGKTSNPSPDSPQRAPAIPT